VYIIGSMGACSQLKNNNLLSFRTSGTRNEMNDTQNSKETGDKALPNEQGPTKKPRLPSRTCRVSGCTSFKQAWTDGRCKNCNKLNLEPREGYIYKRSTKGNRGRGGDNKRSIGPEQVNQHGEDSILLQNEDSAATTSPSPFSEIGLKGNGGKGGDRGSTIGSEQVERLEGDIGLHDLEHKIRDGDGDGTDNHGGNGGKGGDNRSTIGLEQVQDHTKTALHPSSKVRSVGRTIYTERMDATTLRNDDNYDYSLKVIVGKLENEIIQLRKNNAHLEQEMQELKSGFVDLKYHFDKLTSELVVTKISSLEDYISLPKKPQEATNGRLSLFMSSATNENDLPTRQSQRGVNPPQKGLQNNGVICFNNALFQTFASLRHLTTLMNNPPQYSKEAYPLNHAFCTILNLMVSQDFGQSPTLDPSSFTNLFLKNRTKFADVQSKFS
jgi:hypothetical protein